MAKYLSPRVFCCCFVCLFINLLFYLFIFGCVGPLFPHAGFFWLRRTVATLHCSARTSHCSGFSCCRARAPGARASVVAAHRLSSCGSWAPEHRLSSCGARAQLLRGMWDLPGPGLKPVSPALAGGFLTTAPPGKPLSPTLSHVLGARIVTICVTFPPNPPPIK